MALLSLLATYMLICGLGSQLLVWHKVHGLLLDVVLALAPLDLSAYVLLWLVEWLPHLARAHSARRKLLHISRIVESIHRVRALRAH